MFTRTKLVLVAAIYAGLASGAWADQLTDAGNAARVGDYPKALSIYRSLAADGDPKAQASLGTMYYEGMGVAKDIPAAIRWLSAAAKGGDLHAKTTLAAIYFGGNGISPDYPRAYQLAASAAAADDAGAQYLLGLIYGGGKGVPVNVKRAFMWFSIAADKGLPLAARDRDVIAKRLDSTGLSEAKRLADECKLANFKRCG